MSYIASFRESIDRTCRFRRITGKSFRFAIEITRQCNQLCRHCFVIRDKTMPPLNALIRIIEDAAAAGCGKIIITGGDPLMRNDLEKIVRVCADANILVDLNSNLIALTQKRAEALLDAGVVEVSVSLYGCEDVHDWLTKVKGSYQRSVRGIKLFRKLNVSVDVHTALTIQGLTKIESLIEQCEKLDISSLTLFTILMFEEMDDFNNDFNIDKDKTLSMIERIRKNISLPIRTIGLRKELHYGCVMNEGILGLTATLHLKPCLLAHSNNKRGIDLLQTDFTIARDQLREEIHNGYWRQACIDKRLSHNNEDIRLV